MEHGCFRHFVLQILENQPPCRCKSSLDQSFCRFKGVEYPQEMSLWATKI